MATLITGRGPAFPPILRHGSQSPWFRSGRGRAWAVKGGRIDDAVKSGEIYPKLARGTRNDSVRCLSQSIPDPVNGAVDAIMPHPAQFPRLSMKSGC